jgi:hypothetical protein
MDIKILSERTSIPVRQIRYVMDHELVPQQSWVVGEYSVGRARAFDEIAGIFIASAAYLLNAGYKRESVRDFLTATCNVMPEMKRNPLNFPEARIVLAGNGAARVQFGDGRYLRWITSRGTGNWIDTKVPGNRVATVSPKVIVELNFGEIRDRVRTVSGDLS